jgi:hypothetical protein
LRYPSCARRDKLPHGGCVFVPLAEPEPAVDALAVLRKETARERATAMAFVDALVSATKQVPGHYLEA